MATSIKDTTRLRNAVAPRLPAVTPEYDPVVFNQLTNVLRQYFNETDNIVNAAIGTNGMRFLSAPFGSFYDTTSQTAVANTATLMTLNSTDTSSEVSVVSGSNIKVTYPGIYNLQFSVQITNSTADDQEVDIWLRQYTSVGVGGDLPGSTGAISVVKKHGAANGATIAGWNYFLTMQGGDYIQLWWSTTNAGASILYRAAQVGPVRPATSSVVLTMTFVSALPA